MCDTCSRKEARDLAAVLEVLEAEYGAVDLLGIEGIAHSLATRGREVISLRRHAWQQQRREQKLPRRHTYFPDCSDRFVVISANALLTILTTYVTLV